MGEKKRFRIPEESGCVRGLVACAAVLLLSQFCWIRISVDGGLDFDFTWIFPLSLHTDGMLLKCQINELGVPILLAILGITYAKKDLELLSAPLIFQLFGALGWIFWEWADGIWDYPEWLWQNCLDLAPLVLLLLVFVFTVSGRLKQKLWLLLVTFGYLAFLTIRFLQVLVSGIGSSIWHSAYLSAYLGVAALYLAYGILGLAMSDDPNRSYQRVGARGTIRQGEEEYRYTAYELLEEKSIARCMLLSGLTLGIYSWFWIYSIMKRIRCLNGKDTSCGVEMLCYLFVPFYDWYWFYTRGGRLADGAGEYNIYLPKRQGIYLLVLLLTDKSMAMAMMQSDLNEFARLKGKRSSAVTEPFLQNDRG